MHYLRQKVNYNSNFVYINKIVYCNSLQFSLFFMNDKTEKSNLVTFYAATGHLMMHMFAAFYFVIVLAIEDDWNFSYDELINLWLLGSLLVGLGSIPAGWLSDRWSRSGMLAIMFIGLGISSILLSLIHI